MLSNKSPLCKLIIGQYAHNYDLFTALEDDRCVTEALLRQKLPVQFVLILFHRNLSGQTEEKTLCAYHEHK